MKSGDGHGARGRLWLRHAFVVAQVAASMILLVVSSLLLRSLAAGDDARPRLRRRSRLRGDDQCGRERYAVDGGLPLSQRIVERVSRCRAWKR